MRSREHWQDSPPDRLTAMWVTLYGMTGSNGLRSTTERHATTLTEHHSRLTALEAIEQHRQETRKRRIEMAMWTASTLPALLRWTAILGLVLLAFVAGDETRKDAFERLRGIKEVIGLFQ